MPGTVSKVAVVVGYAAACAMASGNSAVSDEARSVWQATRAVADSAELSQWLFGAKAAAISQIWTLAEECAEPGWDGDAAEPIALLAARQAVSFVRALPDSMPLPEFAPEPDGSISLDWIQSRLRLFSLSVGSTDRLAYAWLDGTDRGHAVARFDGVTIPPRVLDGIAAITNHEHTALRVG